MKWESAPLWPVVLPSVTGLILAFIPYIFQTDYFTTRNLLTPVIILALGGLLVFLLNEKYGNKTELYLGYVLGLIVFYSFRFFFGFFVHGPTIFYNFLPCKCDFGEIHES